ncbi:zinc finger protein 354B-like [Ruditapes philippinarum]|uniref:zinc finger protein 354B-like n=1 Tax=Ruditapes philippinarum TaxID=129788 RepID=UPI00295BC808|nr:zinc finger protein 354B-like [Ruditapes philippinarum]
MGCLNTKHKATKQVNNRKTKLVRTKSRRPRNASRSFNTVSSRKHSSNKRTKRFTFRKKRSRDKYRTKQNQRSNAHKSKFRKPYFKQTKRVKCSSCERQFSARYKLKQHQKDKHQGNQSTKVTSFQNNHQQNTHKFSCFFCPIRCPFGRHLTQHTKDEHKIDEKDFNHSVNVTCNAKSLNGEKCIHCLKVFTNASELSEHQRDKHEIDPTSEKCATLGQIKGKHNIEQTRKSEPSQTTAKVESGNFETQQQFALKRIERKKVIDEYYAQKVDIDKDEKKISVELVNDTLAKIMKHVNGQKGGDIYCPNHRKAGSFPMNTKIGKPDEFDTNICLKLEQQDVKVSRGKSIHYTYGETEHTTNMNVKCELSKTEAAIKAPNGYAIVSTTCDKYQANYYMEMILSQGRFDVIYIKRSKLQKII